MISPRKLQLSKSFKTELLVSSDLSNFQWDKCHRESFGYFIVYSLVS